MNQVLDGMSDRACIIISFSSNHSFIWYFLIYEYFHEHYFISFIIFLPGSKYHLQITGEEIDACQVTEIATYLSLLSI